MILQLRHDARNLPAVTDVSIALKIDPMSTHGNRMGMIDEQLDCCTVLWLVDLRCRAVDFTALPQLLVKFNQVQRLILNVGEEVVVANEAEDAWLAKLEIEWQGFARLPIDDVAVKKRSALLSARAQSSCSQLCDSFHQHTRLGLSLNLTEDGKDDGSDIVNVRRPGLDRSVERLVGSSQLPSSQVDSAVWLGAHLVIVP